MANKNPEIKYTELQDSIFQKLINVITNSAADVMEASVRADDVRLVANFVNFVSFAAQCHKKDSKQRGIFICVDEGTGSIATMQVFSVNADQEEAAAFISAANESMNVFESKKVMQ